MARPTLDQNKKKTPSDTNRGAGTSTEECRPTSSFLDSAGQPSFTSSFFAATVLVDVFHKSRGKFCGRDPGHVVSGPAISPPQSTSRMGARDFASFPLLRTIMSPRGQRSFPSFLPAVQP